MSSRPRRFGINDDIWLYQGLAWLLVGKLLAIAAIALVLATLWKLVPGPAAMAWAAAAAVALMGGLMSFHGLTMLLNRSRRVVLVWDEVLLVGTRWGHRQVRLAEIEAASDVLDGVCLWLHDGQRLHIAGNYFAGAGERRLFLEALPRSIRR